MKSIHDKQNRLVLDLAGVNCEWYSYLFPHCKIAFGDTFYIKDFKSTEFAHAAWDNLIVMQVFQQEDICCTPQKVPHVFYLIQLAC